MRPSSPRMGTGGCRPPLAIPDLPVRPMRFPLCLSLTLALTLPAAAQEAKLVSAKPGDAPAVEVTLPKETVAKLKAAKLTDKQWHDVFRVVVAGGKPEELLARPALAGTYTLTDTGVRFEPQLPLVPGLEYRAVVDNKPGATLSILKPPPGPRVAISAVYPSGNRLPENALRWYVHFTGPVARGNVYRHFKLVRDDGVEVMSPFLELPEELWSPDGTR